MSQPHRWRLSCGPACAGRASSRLSPALTPGPAPLDRFGTAPDGRLLGGRRGNILSESTYGRIWQRARERALTAAQQDSPLVARPYDLRHSRVTLGLAAGVPAPEVARRAGHSVAVLLRIYAGCIDGHEQLWNARLDQALGDKSDRDGVSWWFRRQPQTAGNHRQPPDMQIKSPRPRMC